MDDHGDETPSPAARQICGECVASDPPAPRNPAFGRVEGENGLAESPKRASEMSEGARGPLPHSERAALDAETLRPRPSPRSGRPEGQCRRRPFTPSPRIRELQVTGFRQG